MKLLFTSAIINDFYEERKKEYIESINQINLLNLFKIDDIFNIECFLTEDSYLETHLENIIYTKTHKHLRNKGVKEAMALKFFCEKYVFDDEEIVVKHTGRYKFLTSLFIECIYDNLDSDVLVRDGVNNQYFTGTFAIKYKYLKEFLNQLNFDEMELKMISLEKKLYDFILNKKLNKIVYNHIDIYSKINNEKVFIW